MTENQVLSNLTGFLLGQNLSLARQMTNKNKNYFQACAHVKPLALRSKGCLNTILILLSQIKGGSKANYNHGQKSLRSTPPPPTPHLPQQMFKSTGSILASRTKHCLGGGGRGGGEGMTVRCFVPLMHFCIGKYQSVPRLLAMIVDSMHAKLTLIKVCTKMLPKFEP